VRLFLFLLLLALPVQAQLISGQAQTPPPRTDIPDGPATRSMLARDIAVLQVLDKVSARTTRLRVPVNSAAAFGLIVITVRSCQVALPSEAPEAAAFIEVSEIDINQFARRSGQVQAGSAQPSRLLFTGWMFASSPALSALEHPTYDVTVTGCEARTATAAERAAGGEEGAPLASATPVAPTNGDAAAATEPAPVD
jgi:hypothetical protein